MITLSVLNLVTSLLCIAIIFIFVAKWRAGGRLFSPGWAGSLDICWDWAEIALNVGLIGVNLTLWLEFGDSWGKVLFYLWTICLISNIIRIRGRLRAVEEDEC